MSALDDATSGADSRLVDDDLEDRLTRWDRELKAKLILLDIGRLERAWARYQRTYKPPAPGQLDLFAHTR